MSKLRVIKPLMITPAMLVSSDAATESVAAWAAGTTYGAGEAHRVIDDNIIWQSLQAANTGHKPADSPTWWEEVSATNPWRMFDLSSSSQTTRANTLTVKLRPGTVVTALAAVGLQGVTVIRVRMVSDAYGLVSEQEIVRRRLPFGRGFWHWCYGRRSEPLTSYITSLPSFVDAEITIEFEGGSDLGVGTLLLGTVSTWGLGVRTGMSLDLQSYSTKRRDEWGAVKLVRRIPSDGQKIPMVLSRAETVQFYRFVASLDGLPALWITDVDAVYGFYESFNVLIAYATASEAQLNIQGFT